VPLNIFVDNLIHFQDFQDSMMNTHYIFIFYFINVFTAMFDQFNAALLNITIKNKSSNKCLNDIDFCHFDR